MIKKYPIRNKSGKEQYIITSTLNERAVLRYLDLMEL